MRYCPARKNLDLSSFLCIIIVNKDNDLYYVEKWIENLWIFIERWHPLCIVSFLKREVFLVALIILIYNFRILLHADFVGGQTFVRKEISAVYLSIILILAGIVPPPRGPLGVIIST